jgi:recombination protein RecA
MSLAEDLEKIVGKNAVQQEVTCFIDTGFAPLNKALSADYRKGLPGGRMVEIFGGSSCGKTAIATEAMACVQKMGGIARFEDHENSFDVSQGIELGLNPEEAFVYKQPETFEESIDNVVDMAREVRDKKLIDPKVPMIAVFDSLASMVPHSKLYDSKGKRKGAEDYGMHDNMALAKCTSAAFPALAKFAYRYNITLLFLNQTRTKPGVTHGDPTTTPGGNAPEFYMTQRISLTRSMLKEDKASDKIITGQEVRAYVKKNKVARPYQEAHWRFVFREDGTGYFDTVQSTLEHMKQVGLLTVSGNYIEWEGKKLYMSQLAAKIREEGRLSELNDMLYATEK